MKKRYKNCLMWSRIIVNVIGVCIFSQTFPLENTSVHLSISSGETRRFERSIYPLSLSTRITTTGSVLPTRISLLIDLIRRRLNSLNNIIPVIRKRSMIDNNCNSVRLDFFLVELSELTFNIVVLKKMNIRSHIGNWSYVHHHYIFNFWKFLLVKTTRQRHI